mgnify:CR=1 FL=1
MYRAEDFSRAMPEESSEKFRSEFRRDYARIIHSPAFRRLQGKTQLFPGADSDYFRNRLTHSLEVSQIAESICFKVNAEHQELLEHPIDPRVVAIAGLAHDLGHPPFGHNGESALDDCMKGLGGFEGNAQTLRILTTLEKKRHREAYDPAYGVNEDGSDGRLGLNLTYRAAAAVLKYDTCIPITRVKGAGLSKGYYASDKAFVESVKKAVCGSSDFTPFKTVECQIMDVADDIAYSTYDIDDAFKGGFLAPLDVLNASPDLVERVAKRVSDRLGRIIDENVVVDSLLALFEGAVFTNLGSSDAADRKYDVVESYDVSKSYASVGYYRTNLTSELITRFISGIKFELNEDCPAMSKVFLDRETEILVEVLKVFSFESTIMSPRLKVSEARGYDIVKAIFEYLSRENGSLLLPDDFRSIYRRVSAVDESAQKRVICDFIAGMTDRYAVEFFGRLTGETHRSIFTPL